ncbi:MAG: DUF3857 domain-containing protein [Acidobacteria bacterium]|nr:DUF3857 domain-containing protein [Acidobacteriota bacterium]MDA1236018.1 DUF3857 domain-containing protein [Acidobacteriota bacterium]
MTRLSLAVWAIAFSTLAFGADPPPGWLTEVASREIPAYDSDVEAVVLLDEETVRVDGAGRVTVSRRGAIRVLQRGGDTRAAERIVYTTDTDRVRKLEGWILYPSGGHEVLEKKDVIEGSLSNNNFYDEARVQVLSAAGQADPGSVFGFESVLERRSIFAQFVYTFQNDLPALTARFTMDLPAGGTAQAATLNAAPIEPLVQGSRYTWELRNLPPIQREAGSPSYSALAPRVAATYFPPPGGAAEMSFAEWSTVGAWLNELSASEMEPDAAVAQKAQELTAGAADAWEKVKAIGEFVQGVTYVSIQIGTGRGGGYTPHPAPQVLRNLYGDCKDKVTLMRSMLKSVGIGSYLVAIHSGDPRYVREEWPSPHQFNHVIVAIEAPEEFEAAAVGAWDGFGRLLLFDPTDSYTPLGLLPTHEQDSWALLTAPAKGLLIRVPAAAPEQNRVEREATVALSAEGGIEVALTERSMGQSATENRALRGRGSEAEYRSIIERWIARGAPAAAVSAVAVNDDPEAAFDLAVKFAAPRYAQLIAGRLLVFKPAIVERRTGTYLTDGERVHPVLLNANAFRETIRFSLPQGYAVDEKPVDVVLHTEFGDYGASWVVQGDELTFARELTVRNADVAPDGYAEVRDFFRAIAGAEQAPVVLAKQ